MLHATMKSAKQTARKQRRARNKSSGITGVLPKPTLIPPSMTGWMSASVTAVGSIPAATGTAVSVIRLNSPFDPDYSLGGASAGGFAQLAALYQRYRVLKANVQIDYSNRTVNPIDTFALVSPFPTAGTSPGEIAKARNVWLKPLSGNQGYSTYKHRMSIPIHSGLGLKASVVKNDDGYQAASNANPAIGLFLHVGAINEAAASAELAVVVRIEFLVNWFYPLPLV